LSQFVSFIRRQLRNLSQDVFDYGFGHNFRPRPV
jgi:hypothetical protein